MSSPVAQVAVGVPLRRLFDYRIPVGMQVAIGSRVRVPFGRTRVIGVVSGLRDTSDLPADRLKPLTAVLDPVPLLGSDDLAFLHWVAAYYHHPIGEVMAAALPLRLRKTDRALLPDEAGWLMTAAGVSRAADPPARAPRQAELLIWLAMQPDVTAPKATMRQMPRGAVSFTSRVPTKDRVRPVTSNSRIGS